MSRQRAADSVSGPMGMETFREELCRPTGGQDIQPVVHGMMRGDTVAWPG